MAEVPGLINTVGTDLPNTEVERLAVPKLPDITGEKFQEVEQRVQRGGELQLKLQDMRLAALQQYYANKEKFLNDKAVFDARDDQRGDNSLASGLIALGGSIIQGVNLVQQNRVLEQRFQLQAQAELSKQQNAELNAQQQQINTEIRADIQRTAAEIPRLIQEFGREQGTEMARVQINRVLNSPQFQNLPPNLKAQIQDLAFGTLKGVERDRASYYLDQQEQIEATEIEAAKQQGYLALTPIVREIEFASPEALNGYIDRFEQQVESYLGTLEEQNGGRPLSREKRLRILSPLYEQLGQALSKYHGRAAETNARAAAYTQLANTSLQLQQLVSAGEISQRDADNIYRRETELSGFPGIGERAATSQSRVLSERVAFLENTQRLQKLERSAALQGLSRNNPELQKYKRAEIGGILFGYLNRDDRALDIIASIEDDKDAYRTYGDSQVDISSIPQLVTVLDRDIETHKSNAGTINSGLRAIAALEPLVNPETIGERRVFVPDFDPITFRNTGKGRYVDVEGLPSPTKIKEEQEVIRNRVRELETENRRIQNNWYRYGIDVVRPDNNQRLQSMLNETQAVQQQVAVQSPGDDGRISSSSRPAVGRQTIQPGTIGARVRKTAGDSFTGELEGLASGRVLLVDFNSQLKPLADQGISQLVERLQSGQPTGALIDSLVTDFTQQVTSTIDREYAEALHGLAKQAGNGSTAFSVDFFLEGGPRAESVINAMEKRDPALIKALREGRENRLKHLEEVSPLYRETLTNASSEYIRDAERSRTPAVPPPRPVSNPSPGVSSRQRGRTNVRNYYTPRTRRANQKNWEATVFTEPTRIVVAAGHQDSGGTQHEQGLVHRASHIFGEVGAEYGFQVDVLDNGKSYKENGYLLQQAQDDGAYAVELHMDMPGGASGVIPPTSGIHVFDDRLAEEFGAFSANHRGGLMLPKLGIRLLELTAVSDDLKSRLGDAEAIDGILRGYAHRFFRSIRGGGAEPRRTQYRELSPGVYQFSNGTVIDVNTGQVRGVSRGLQMRGFSTSPQDPTGTPNTPGPAPEPIFKPRKVNWQNMSAPVSKYFTVSEVTKGQTARIPQDAETQKNILRSAHLLDQIREAWGSGIIVTSWYRPPHLKIGAKNSKHKNGTAVDMAPANGKIHEFQEWLTKSKFAKYAIGLGAHKGFVHIDLREGGIRWTYAKNGRPITLPRHKYHEDEPNEPGAAPRVQSQLVPIYNETTRPMREVRVSGTERGHNNPDNNYGYAALEGDPRFRTALAEVANKYGFNAAWLADIIDFESAGSWSTSIDNGLGFIGLIQVGAAVREDFRRLGLPAADPNYIKGLSRAEYIRQVVDPYLDLHVNRYSSKKRIDSVGDLVAVIFGGHRLLDTREEQRNKVDAFGTPYSKYIQRIGERANRRYNTNSSRDRISRATQVVHREPRPGCPVCQAQLSRWGSILPHYDPR